MKRMIFHIPWKINPRKASASQIRPKKMLEAFKSIGYHVDVVMGSGKSRHNSILNIKNSIKTGVVFDFVYSESSTGPTIIANGWKDSILHFNQDLMFLKYCSKKNIPVALYYRDIQWKFKELYNVPFYKKIIFTTMFKFDLIKYRNMLYTLYLPNLRMSKYLPFKYKNIKSLPPGCNEVNYTESTNKGSNFLNLFYVGGCGPMYNVETLFKVVSKLDKVKLVYCTREKEWNDNKHLYEKYITDNIHIIHKKGEELNRYYAEADIGVLFVKPVLYDTFAIPVKMYEYLSYSMPMIAASNVVAGEWVSENKVGWAVSYGQDELYNLLSYLQKNKDEVEKIKSNLLAVRSQNLWSCRASQVVEDLLTN